MKKLVFILFILISFGLQSQVVYESVQRTNIYDFLDETAGPPNVKAPHFVFKCPGLPDLRQKDCTRIMIMKNPYDIFGSFYLRFGEEYLRIKDRSIPVYEEYVNHFLTTRDYKVRYEDLFVEPTLEALFDYLGFEFEGIKDEKSSIGYQFTEIPEERPDRQTEGTYHARYRMWQLNQPFQNMTGNSARHLPEQGRIMISRSKIIEKLYGQHYNPIR